MKLNNYLLLKISWLVLTIVPLSNVTLWAQSKGYQGAVSSSAVPARMTEDDIELQDKYLKGVHLQQLGKTEGAIRAFMEVLERDPRNDAAAYQLARIYARQDDPRRAIEWAQKAVSLDPNNIWYKYLLGEFYERNGEFRKAAEIYKQLISNTKQNPDEEIVARYAENLSRIGDFDAALRAYDDLEKIEGIQDEISRKKFAICLTKKDYKRATTELKRLVAHFPNRLDLQHILAEFYLSQGQQKEGEAIYQQILARNPKDTKANLVLAKRNQLNNAAQGKESVYLQSLKPTFAKSDMAIDAKIKELLPYVNRLADRNIKTDTDTKNALIELAQILTQAHPNEAKAYSIYGDVLYQLSDLQEALTQYEKCLGLTKSVYAVWEQKMMIEDELGDYQALQKTSEAALDLYPNQATVFFFNGLAAFHLKKNAIADESLSQALMMTAKRPALQADVMTLLGSLRARQQRFEEAEKLFEDATKLAPKSSLVALRYALAQLLRGGAFVVKGEQLATQALNPTTETNPRILELYGDFLFYKGDTARAVEYWQKAQQNGSKSKALARKIEEKKL
jgi:tetratricopeptide (TPR) repeat protein